MHHRVHALQQAGRQGADVAEVLGVQHALRQRIGRGEAVREISGVEADQLGPRQGGAEVPRYDGADIAHVAGDQDAQCRVLVLLRAVRAG